MTTPHHHRHHHEDMLNVEEAKKQILEVFYPLELVDLPILESLNLVLGQDIVSTLNIPPLDNSAMDGYAVISSDLDCLKLNNPIYLRVIGQIAAGQFSRLTVTQGTTVRIMTGAMLPEGANAIIPFEETTESDSKPIEVDNKSIGIKNTTQPGAFIRKAGGDISMGDTVFKKGEPIRSSTIGVLASLGLSKVTVHRRPLVAILSTGDELLNPGESNEPAKIYDSNISGLAAAVIQAGGVPQIIGIAKDNIASIEEKLANAVHSDLVISSAGVSKGDYDIVKDVLSSHGQLQFWSVRMRPAKPLAFGFLDREDISKVPFLGLPGNPVSAHVAFEQFCRPAIRKMMGKQSLDRPTIQAQLEDKIDNYDGRRVYARVKVRKVGNDFIAKTTGLQDSNILTSMASANGLAICPEFDESKLPGDTVTVIMLDWPEDIL